MDGGKDAETYKAELIEQVSGKTVTGYIKLTHDPRKVIAELATSQVGRALGLRVPRPYVAILDTADLREELNSDFTNRGHIVCFASKQAGARSYSLERALNGTTAEILDQFESSFDIGSTIALDEFVANDDRNLGNIIYHPGKREFWLIDHGRALTGTYWTLWGLDDPSVSVGNCLADQGAQEWDEAKRNAVLESTRELISKCAQLCLDELDQDGHFAKIDAATDKQEIVNFLRERIQHTVPLLCQRLQLGHLPLTQPPRS